jgi:hypothetical protein
MRGWLFQILLALAAAAVIGCSQPAAQPATVGDGGGDWPYEGPIVDETGQAVVPPDWEVAP